MTDSTGAEVTTNDLQSAPQPIPLPEALSTCECTGRPVNHGTGCTVAADFEAGQKKGREDWVDRQYNIFPDTSLAFKVGYERTRNQKVGVRYQQISWVYPLTVRGMYDSNINIHLDPRRYIDHVGLDDYDAFNESTLYGEKPLDFIATLICEDLDLAQDFTLLGNDPGIVSDRSQLLDTAPQFKFSVHTPDGPVRNWTHADTLTLHKDLGLTPEGRFPEPDSDPNQDPGPDQMTIFDVLGH